MTPDNLSQRETLLLEALAGMCVQYLQSGAHLDNLCMSAGEDALRALAYFGFVELSSGERIGTWTEAGQRFLDNPPIYDWPDLGPSDRT